LQVFRANELAGAWAATADSPGELAGGFEDEDLMVALRKECDATIGQASQSSYLEDPPVQVVPNNAVSRLLQEHRALFVHPQHKLGIRAQAPELPGRSFRKVVLHDIHACRIPDRYARTCARKTAVRTVRAASETGNAGQESGRAGDPPEPPQDGKATSFSSAPGTIH